MYGSHLSIAGGMHLAIGRARELGMTTVQVFTGNRLVTQCISTLPTGSGFLRHLADWLTSRPAAVFTCAVLIWVSSVFLSAGYTVLKHPEEAGPIFVTSPFARAIYIIFVVLPGCGMMVFALFGVGRYVIFGK